MVHQPFRRTMIAILGICLAQACLAPAFGGPPNIFQKMFQKRQPLNEEALTLKPEHGPWLIFATAIPGENARENAITLARELRTALGQPTFVMEKVFDTSGVLGSTTKIIPDVNGGATQYRAWTQYANGSREQVFAVLVGEFSTTEDPRIETVLKAIRTAQPATLSSLSSPSNTEDIGSNSLVQKYRAWLTKGSKEAGPMGTAFLTRNPLLPEEFFLDTPKVDELVEKLNKNVEHSLLDCPGKYTVRVATFTGKEVTDFGNGARASQLPAQLTDTLDRAAYKANKLTTALREDKVEAYEFHDRYGSYVTIGSFDSLGSQLPDGQFQYNPDMQLVMNQYCGYRNINARDPITNAVIPTTSVNSKDKIPFDIQGKPIAVPRPSAKSYAGSLLGRR